MPEERLSSSLQESIGTAVALVDDENSTLIASLVDPDLLDPPISDIVAKCVEYRNKYKKPPGKSHIDDLFAYVLEDKEHKQYSLFNRIIRGMVAQSASINTNFVLSNLQEFMWRIQNRLKIQKLSEIYQKGDVNCLDELEKVYREGLRIRTNEGDLGFTLASSEALRFFDRDSSDYCLINIQELDKYGVHPTKKELLLFQAARNRGKSWFLHHCGKYAALKGWKVLHITLENSPEMTSQRYFQSFFSGVKREGSYHYTSFVEDKNKPLRVDSLKPAFVVSDKDEAVKFLSKSIKEFHYKMESIRIKSFPTGKLTFGALEKYLDQLALSERFEPDIILLDSPQLMRLDRQREKYQTLEELSQELRGLAGERNLAMVITHQGNREAERAKLVSSYHASDSIGVFAVADNGITFSQTESEEKHGLARLFTQKVRNDQARVTVLISQHYPSGQFCMSSKIMTDALRDAVKGYIGMPKSGELEGDEEDLELEQKSSAYN